jgi:hypothetical protein
LKHQYFGDINDYRKYGLIQALSGSGLLPTYICLVAMIAGLVDLASLMWLPASLREARFLNTLPRPASFYFQLHSHTEESTDQDDQAKYQDVFQCGCYNDCPNNVACDEELKTQ